MCRYVWVYIVYYIQYRYACMYANALLYISREMESTGTVTKKCSTSNAMSGAMIFSSSLGCGFSTQMTMQQRDSYRKPGFRLPKITTESRNDKKKNGKNTIFRVPCKIMTVLNENNIQSFFWYLHEFHVRLWEVKSWQHLATSGAK